MAGFRFRIASPAAAAALGGLVFGLLVAAVPLVLLTGDTREINDGGALAVELAVLGVGLVVARTWRSPPVTIGTRPMTNASCSTAAMCLVTRRSRGFRLRATPAACLSPRRAATGSSHRSGTGSAGRSGSSSRAELTHRPAGWTDENLRALPDGSILFVRTREMTVKDPSGDGWRTTANGRLELITGNRTALVGTTSWTSDGFGGSFVEYYGHYGWPWLVAVTP